MADNHPPKTRSFNMSRIKSSDTKPEEIVRKFLFSKGFRYRKNDKRYPGKPDIVLPKYKTVVFVNGCFWHAHEGCSCFVWPENNEEYCHKKLTNNAERDKRNYLALEQIGWKVIVLWECQLTKDKLAITMKQLMDGIKKW